MPPPGPAFWTRSHASGRASVNVRKLPPALGSPRDAEPPARRAVEHAERGASPHFLGPAHRTLATTLHSLLAEPGADASLRDVEQHLSAAEAAFERASMTAEVEATRALRARYL